MLRNCVTSLSIHVYFFWLSRHLSVNIGETRWITTWTLFCKCVYGLFQGFDIPSQAWCYSDFSLPNSFSETCKTAEVDPNSVSDSAFNKELNTNSHLKQVRKRPRNFTFASNSGKSMRRKPKLDEFRQHRDFRRPFMYRRLKLRKMVKFSITVDYKEVLFNIWIAIWVC